MAQHRIYLTVEEEEVISRPISAGMSFSGAVKAAILEVYGVEVGVLERVGALEEEFEGLVSRVEAIERLATL